MYFANIRHIFNSLTNYLAHPTVSFDSKHAAGSQRSDYVLSTNVSSLSHYLFEKPVRV